MAKPTMGFWEIGAENAEKLSKFYTDLFNWEAEYDAEMDYRCIKSGGEEAIDGGIFQIRDDIPKYFSNYVIVDDLQSYLDKAVSLGGQIIKPPMEIPNIGSIAIFLDPEGNCIGLFKKNK